VILLDTHVLVWSVVDTKRLSRDASRAISRALDQDGVAVSAITIWELASLVARGRVRAHGTIDASVRLFLDGVAVKPITPEIAALATTFPESYPNDPADRLIGATARAEGLALVTRDEKMLQSPLLRTVW
jgi:PIN domain nuclease of toxin-antitoxin system